LISGHPNDYDAQLVIGSKANIDPKALDRAIRALKLQIIQLEEDFN
jgi:hypothetical protein